MRFAKRTSPPPYVNSRDQWRLLGLVVMLLLVLLAARIAARPQTWTWLFPSQPVPQTEPVDGGTSQNLNFEVNLADEDELPADGFRSERARQPVQPPDDESRPAESQAGRDEQFESEDGSRNVASIPAETERVDQALFASVTDNTLGIRRSESEAYYAVLARARDADQSDLNRAALDRAPFHLLMTEPERYRGRPVRIEGELKRLVELDADQNDAGIDRLFEAWILTRESGNNLYHVVSTEIAKGLPLDAGITHPVGVQVTGLFFKNEGYAARRGLHTAPLLLAKRLHKRPAAANAQVENDLVPYLIGITLAVSLSIGITLLYYRAGDRRARRRRREHILEPLNSATSPLDGVHSEDPRQFLRDLSELIGGDEKAASGESGASAENNVESAGGHAADGGEHASARPD